MVWVILVMVSICFFLMLGLDSRSKAASDAFATMLSVWGGITFITSFVLLFGITERHAIYNNLTKQGFHITRILPFSARQVEIEVNGVRYSCFVESKEEYYVTKDGCSPSKKPHIPSNAATPDSFKKDK